MDTVTSSNRVGFRVGGGSQDSQAQAWTQSTSALLMMIGKRDTVANQAILYTNQGNSAGETTNGSNPNPTAGFGIGKHSSRDSATNDYYASICAVWLGAGARQDFSGAIASLKTYLGI